MLVTFQSRATPDVVMLRDLAAYLLGAIGKRLGERGVIAHEEMRGAIIRLEATLEEDAKIAQEHGPNFHATVGDHSLRTRAGLRHRALPFLDMLRQAELQDAAVLWGL
ncbi:hypothetical protein AWB74_08814 [Caballeronia arvi]|uniref:DUF1840 domain-containing protein n=1 Tax=Caballeronia arvi TaxID=1777135 RepID=A0A158L7B4_9BURK|nr:DUF1840 domain-containing protein [Caballeronia arvi]SAL88941.1 hypothetical protein AWB74_08814 [Caballeronia arvi]